LTSILAGLGGGGTFNNNADNVATSATNGQAAAWSYVWDGAAWDRLYGDSTNGAFVNVKTSVLPTGAATSVLQSTINTTLGSPFQAGGSIGNTAFIANAGTNLNTSALMLDATGQSILTAVGSAIPAGTAIIGKVGIDQTTPGTTNAVAFTNTTLAVTNAGTFAVQAAQATAANLNATVVGTGTFATQATLAAETTKVIGTVNQGTSPWVVSGTVTAGGVAQGSTTAGQTGSLSQCAVTTAAPTYTTAQTDPLSCDTTGNLRVNVVTATGLAQGSTTSGQTGSMIMGAVTTAAPSYTTAQTAYASLTTAGGLRSDVASWAGTALGAPANFGTTPGAVVAGSANASMFVGTVAVASGNGVAGTGTPRVTIASDNTAFSVNSTLSAETTKVIGTVNVAAAQTIAATNAGTFAVQSQPTPVTSGGLSVYFVQPTASDNHVVIKAGAGQVYKVSATNNSATVNYLRLYNATTGFNGCNSATNLVYQVAIPASTSVGGISDSWDSGIAFATGISICVTSGYATNDTTNATASAMSVNIGYK
jgi:hypothetical protein